MKMLIITTSQESTLNIYYAHHMKFIPQRIASISSKQYILVVLFVCIIASYLCVCINYQFMLFSYIEASILKLRVKILAYKGLSLEH